MTRSYRPDDGTIRAVSQWQDGLVHSSSAHFNASKLPFMKQYVDDENQNLPEPATYWIEQYDAGQDEWKTIYPRHAKGTGDLQ